MDQGTLAKIYRAEADNVRFAQQWRALMRERRLGPLTDTEALRLTAKAAVEDWLEARD